MFTDLEQIRRIILHDREKAEVYRLLACYSLFANWVHPPCRLADIAGEFELILACVSRAQVSVLPECRFGYTLVKYIEDCTSIVLDLPARKALDISPIELNLYPKLNEESAQRLFSQQSDKAQWDRFSIMNYGWFLSYDDYRNTVAVWSQDTMTRGT